MTAFNARAARAKRPLPLWIDSIITDTQHLEADEYGVYIRLLGAMWRRESCDLPLDERRLATIGGVSPRLWRSRIGPAVLPFFEVSDGTIQQKRLRKEAVIVEAFLEKQSRRRAAALPESDPYAEPEVTQLRDGEIAENGDNQLTKLEPDRSADKPRTPPRRPPTSSLQPTIGGGGGSDAEHDAILIAAGVDPTKDVTGKWVGLSAQHEVASWRALGLTQSEIIDVVRDVRRGGRHPPSTLSYFRQPMQRAAGLKTAAPLDPIPPSNHATGGSRHGRQPDSHDRTQRVIAGAVDRALARHQARVASGPDQDPARPFLPARPLGSGGGGDA